MKTASDIPVSSDLPPPAETGRMREGIARLVRIEGDQALLSFERDGSCAGCASSALCGSRGSGAEASLRLPLAKAGGLTPGARAVFGIDEHALRLAALAIYGLPPFLALAASVLAQAACGSDAASAAAMATGLALGIGAARLIARRLASQGRLQPRLLRLVSRGAACPE